MGPLKDVAASYAKFIAFWLLTLTYGAMSVVYIVCSLIRSRRTKDVGIVSKEVQPSCLSEPIYGRHRYIKREGFKLHFVESGDPCNPLVILIHSTPGFWFCWRKQIAQLSQYSWVVAMDLRGCGDSDASWTQGRYRVCETVKDIVYLIKVLERDSATLICNEISGQIGWQMSFQHPELVSKLVLINGPHPDVLRILFHSSWKHYLRMWYLLFVQIPVLPEVLVHQRWEIIFQRCLSSPIKTKTITEEELRAYRYTFSRKEDWLGPLHLLRQINLRPINVPIQPFSIKCPTLLLMSSSHPCIPKEAAYRSAEFSEKIKIRIVDGEDNLQITDSPRIRNELASFLKCPVPNTTTTTSPTAPSRSYLVKTVMGAVKNPYSMLPTSGYLRERLGAN